MKILELKIMSPNDELIRMMNIRENGLTLIYGDIKRPEVRTSTINSLGKTLLLKMIDYVLGANNDSTIMKEAIHDYYLDAKVKYKSKKYNVKRIIGTTSPSIFIDGEPKSITEYRNFFGISRKAYDKQVILFPKASLVSLRQNASVSDYETILRMLSFDSLTESIKDIYKTQDDIKQLKKSKNDLISVFEDSLKENNETIEQRIYLINKKEEEFKNEIALVAKKIKSLQISDYRESSIKEYEKINMKFKRLRHTIEQYHMEKNRLSNYMKEIGNTKVTNSQLLKLYEKAKFEIPSMVVRKLEEVEGFHQSVIKDREETINKRIKELEGRIEKYNRETELLSNRLSDLGKLIAENRVYQEAIELYESYSNKLRELTYEQGQLSRIKEIDRDIDKNDSDLVQQFDNAKEALNKRLLKKYRDFVYDFVKSIYDEEVDTFFDIKIKSKHQTHRPIEFILNMMGDTGEGITEVQKNIIDYLLFKYNHELELMVQDSSCYNGIDPRQVSNMLLYLNEIAVSEKKQAIVAINKFQLTPEHDIFELINDRETGVALSENEKLLKFNF